jgi:hypothetical protein
MHTTTSLLAALAGATIVLAGPAPAPPRPLITARPVRPFPGQHLAARQDFTDGGPDASWTSFFHDYEIIIDSAPTPATEVAEWLRTAAPLVSVNVDDLPNMHTFTTVCDETAAPTPPASLSSAWASFTSAADSWYDGQSSAVASLQSACTGDISIVAAMRFATDGPECTSAVLAYVSWVHSTMGFTPTEATATATTTTSLVDAPEPTGATGGDKGETADDKTGEDEEGEGEGAGEDNSPSTTQSTAGVAAARETGLVAAVAAVALGVAGVVAGF